MDEFSELTGAPRDKGWVGAGIVPEMDYKIFDNKFMTAVIEVYASGGRIFFNLDGIDLRRVLKAKGRSHWDFDDVSVTDWELNQIIDNQNLLDATDFYRNGKKIQTQDLLDELGSLQTNQ